MTKRQATCVIRTHAHIFFGTREQFYTRRWRRRINKIEIPRPIQTNAFVHAAGFFAKCNKRRVVPGCRIPFNKQGAVQRHAARFKCQHCRQRMILSYFRWRNWRLQRLARPRPKLAHLVNNRRLNPKFLDVWRTRFFKLFKFSRVLAAIVTVATCEAKRALIRP